MAKICPVTDGPVLYITCVECGDREACEKRRLRPDFALLIVGSRTITDYALVKRKLDHLIRPIRDRYDFRVVSGGADGVDTLAERYARENGFETVIMKPDWEKYGGKAGYYRNREMHRYISGFTHRGCVAFWDGKSKGTQHSIRLASEYDNPLRFITVLPDSGGQPPQKA